MKCIANYCIILIFQIVFASLHVNAQQKLENPITENYLKKYLSQESPKLILTPKIEKELMRKLKTDPLVQNYYNYLKKEADSILTKPLLKRELEGFRLLFVSRAMVERMTTLSMVYRVDKKPEILKRIDAELKAVCNFVDWNPQHFLDVAEMSFAVALAVDWVGNSLPNETVKLAKASLIEKGILRSYNENGERMGWISGSNNWNAVCHGGMIAASLAIADLDPELAAKTISRALDKLPNSLKEYAPDGVYPEGPTYWSYGTGYSVVAANTLTTALGSDFGISQSPGFMESGIFNLHVTAPSGYFFNFADSGDKKDGDDSVLRTWFASQTGDELYFDRAFYESPEGAGRFAGVALVWLSQYKQQTTSVLPASWHGNGVNPVAVFRGEMDNPFQFFLGAKGGKAQLSHGNMDAGTFVFDLNGVRWVVDPGNQRYYLLNKIGFNLAGGCQDCPRWTLLTKNNQGHSTVTINDAHFDVTGKAKIIDFKDGKQPEVTIDMTDLYFGNVTSMQRHFVKESDQSILIEDAFEINDSTKTITWGLMTQSVVQLTKDGATLSQDGKQLKLTILKPEGISVSVISLDPPPMEIDKTMENLKRIEIRLPAYTVIEKKGINTSPSIFRINLSELTE
ncbi:MAG: heparinase II/III family protein [Bacteroidia bacterium]|nr:heparinase II/III family protein [Bacteroidia bacterium]